MPDRNDGKKALARWLERVCEATRRIENGEDSNVVANDIWLDFREAIALAQDEIDAVRLDGYTRWLEYKSRPKT